MKDIGIDTGCVYDIAGLVFAVVGADFPDPVFLLQVLNPRIEAEVDPVYIGVLRHGDIELEGADDAGGLCIENAYRIGCEIGLELPGLIAGKNLHVGNTVLHAPVVEGLNTGLFTLVQADDEGTVPAEGDIEVPAQVVHHLIAADIHLRHH